MSSSEVQSEILDAGSFDVPCGLTRPTGFSTYAVVDETGLYADIKKLLHKAAWPAIYKDIFEHLRPNYGDNPSVALNHLSQETTDAQGNKKCMSVAAYDKHFWNVTRHLHGAMVDDYKQDLCPPYIKGFIDDIRIYIERQYANYCQSIPTTVSAPRKALKVIYNHALKAEQDCKAFNLRLDRKLGRPDASTFVAGAHAQAPSFPSVAENTIAKYLSGPSMGKPKRGPCLGCESVLHLAINYPRQNEPEVRARIHRAVESIRAARKARSNKGERSGKNTPNFSDFSRGHKKKFRSQVLAAMAAEEEESADDDRSSVPRHNDRGSRDSRWVSPPSSDTRPDDDYDRRPYYSRGEYDRDLSPPARSNNSGRAYHGRAVASNVRASGSPTTKEKNLPIAVAAIEDMMAMTVTTTAEAATVLGAVAWALSYFCLALF